MKKKRSYKIFLMYLISYITIAFVPIICIFAIYYSDIRENLLDNAVKEEMSNMDNTIFQMDTTLSDINNLPYQIYKNTYIRQYEKKGTTLARMSAIAELKSIAGGNELIDDMYVYFRDYETFVGAYNNSYNRQDVMEGKILSFQRLTPEEFLTTLESVRRLTVFPAMEVEYGYRIQGKAISWIETLPPDNSFARGSVVIFVNASKIEKLLNVDQREYILYDNEGQVILQSDIQNYTEKEINDIMEKNADKTSVVLNSDTIMSWGQSDLLAFRLVVFKSLEDMQDLYERQRHQMLLIFIFLSLIATILITFFMEKIFRPVGELVKVSSEYNGEDITSFKTIENTMRSLQLENVQLSTRIKNLNPIAVESTAKMLLSTPKEQWKAEEFERGKEMGLNLECAQYQVLLLHYVNLETMRNVLSSIWEYCGSVYVFSFVETAKKYIVLMLGSKEKGQLLYKQVEIDSLEADYVAVGPQVDSVQRWNESYVCALLAFDALGSGSEIKLLHYEELPLEAYAGYPWMTMQAFAAAISQENIELVKELGKEIEGIICTDLTETLEKRQIIFTQSILLFKDKLPQHKEVIEEYVKYVYSHNTELNKYMMQKLLTFLVSEYCTEIEEEQKAKEESPIYRSLAIIHDMVGSQELSIQNIADQVGMSVTLYSTCFHQEMGYSFKKYVDMLRLNRAKQLLNDTEMSISEVALMVGYANPYSFLRMFKRLTDMTPSEYRQDKNRNRSEHGINKEQDQV